MTTLNSQLSTLNLENSQLSTLNLILPSSWEELTDDQLRLVFLLFAEGRTAAETKTICLLRWNKIEVFGKVEDHKYWVRVKKEEFFVTSRQLQAATASLDFLDSLPEFPVRISKIGKYRPLPADFSGVPFEKYMFCENIYQGYLHTERMELLQQLLQILYDSDKVDTSPEFAIMAFYWFSALKQYFAQMFPYFFQPVEGQQDNMLQSSSLRQRLTDAVNAQIRALTMGDVTKEPYVMQMDTIRALTELNEKAREADELRKKK